MVHIWTISATCPLYQFYLIAYGRRPDLLAYGRWSHSTEVLWWQLISIFWDITRSFLYACIYPYKSFFFVKIFFLISYMLMLGFYKIYFDVITNTFHYNFTFSCNEINNFFILYFDFHLSFLLFHAFSVIK
jgi:hypothetical protein